jgi:acetylornithine deacetylase/succinyl-diaminopimelate desuccinylase-like protein
MSQVEEYVKSRRKKTLEELKEILRIPSVSTLESHRKEMLRCAQLVARRMKETGLQSRILRTDRHPAVYGERIAGSGSPTVLVYGHYDVQPPDPLGLWRHDPFEPTEEEGLLYARGASDDKGQFFALLKGIEAFLNTREGPRVSVKVIVEGEEEIGSPSLRALIRQERALLSADVVVVADGSQFARDLPAITYGLKGLVFIEATVRGPSKDLHSGAYGGTVANPANVLARMLAACQGPFGRVAIPGFYDDVRSLEAWEREEFAKLPFREEEYREEIGVPKLFGEEGFTTIERKWARPTFDLNGLSSGFSGEGAKTVLPAEARAKISMRLVPDQDPSKIVRLVTDFLRSVAPDTVRVDCLTHHASKPVLLSRDGAHVRAAVRAFARAFGREPVFVREGGSIPVVNAFQEELGLESLLLGIGLPDDDAHAPNEKIRIEDVYRGAVLMGAFLEGLEA